MLKDILNNTFMYQNTTKPAEIDMWTETVQQCQLATLAFNMIEVSVH